MFITWCIGQIWLSRSSLFCLWLITWCNFPKNHLELDTLGEIIVRKGLKILITSRPIGFICWTHSNKCCKNTIHYCWNGIGQHTIQVVTSNLEHLINVETLLSFSYIVPLLNNMKNLIKLEQAQDIFVIHLVQTIKLT